MLYIYRLFINLALIISPLIITIRLLKNKENLKRFTEKFGIIKQIRPRGKLIWFHVASVGEFQSIIPLLEKYEKSKKISKILITSNTLSSSKIISEVKLKKIIHQFFPIDHNFIVKKFIEYWNPSMALFVDSEIWPNMIINLKKKNIPILLLNARLTKKSYKRWIKFRALSKLLFSKFDLCLSSNKESAGYLKNLGAKKIKYFGNLKYTQSKNEQIAIDTQTKNFITKKRVWCASSTHQSEEKFAGQVHKLLKKKYNNLLTVIIPRHIDREQKIKDEMFKLGLNVHLHEPKTKIQPNTDIYLVNSFGITKSFFSQIKNVFLGGSLVNHGGQNPLEAAKFGCNILHGPNIDNFNEVYKFLKKQKISKKIYNEIQTANILKKLLSSKNYKKNIKNKIEHIGKKILKENLYQINKILNKI